VRGAARKSLPEDHHPRRGASSECSESLEARYCLLELGAMSGCWRAALLAAVLLGPLLCEAALDSCEGVDGFEMPGDK